MLTLTLAQYYYGFEGSVAAKIFMVGFAVLALLAALLIRLSAYQWIMAGMLFFTALTAATNTEQTAFIQTWMLPIQLRRAEAHLVLGILMTILVVLGGKVHMHTVPVQGLFLLAISVYAGLLQFFHEGATEALQSIGFAFAVLPCMLFAAPAATRDHNNCVRTLRAMMCVSVLWTVCSSIQFMINPRFLVNTQGRFWGMLGNAQQAAMLVAPFAIIAIWLTLHDKSKKLRPLWIGLIAINLLFLGWTASRTGFVMLVIGASFVLYNRIGKVLLFLPVAVLLFVALAFLSDELQIRSNLERLTDLQNTRQGVWEAQFRNIAESPLIGVGWHDTGGSESSWFGGFAGYGIGMFLLMIGLLVWSMWRCAVLWVRRRRLPKEERPLVDMYISWNAMYFSAATFEGIILGRSSTSQVFLLMFAGIGVYLAEKTATLADQPIDEYALDPAEYGEIPPEYLESAYAYNEHGKDYPQGQPT